MSESMISVRGLTKTFGKQQVFSDISFEIAANETFALLGRNGAGKTTLIRILLGLLDPDAGSVRVAGHNPAESAVELRRQVGYLAEDQTMYGWMTAIELARYLKPFYPTWDDGLTSKLLDGFEIPRHSRIETLSKGQNVKLGLCMALAHRPQVAILDDPALGLDPIARKQFSRDLVEHLQGAGCTVFYSSHLLHEVEAVADTVAILDDGCIVRQSATEVLRRQVKQFNISTNDASELPRPTGLLDLETHGQQVVMIVDEAAEFQQQLESRGVPYDIADLNLDDIFAAYVIGRTHAWPSSSQLTTTAGRE